MMNKTHSHNLNHTFDGKRKCEEMPCLFNKLISWLFVISIVVFITHHEDGVNENHKNNEVIKHWPADELNCFVTEAIAFKQAEARISVENDELIELFEFVSCSKKFFLLWTHHVFTEQLHFFVLSFSPFVFITCFGEILHVLSQFLFFLFGIHILFFF